MHQRLAPKRYALRHALFMFYIDLDELDLLSNRLRLFSRRAWNLYSFRDDDHMPGCGDAGTSLKHRLGQYLSGHGIHLSPGSHIRLLTLPRMLGYVFNPISLYFCFEHEAHTPVCAVAEVGNHLRRTQAVPAAGSGRGRRRAFHAAHTQALLRLAVLEPDAAIRFPVARARARTRYPGG